MIINNFVFIQQTLTHSVKEYIIGNHTLARQQLVGIYPCWRIGVSVYWLWRDDGLISHTRTPTHICVRFCKWNLMHSPRCEIQYSSLTLWVMQFYSPDLICVVSFYFESCNENRIHTLGQQTMWQHQQQQQQQQTSNSQPIFNGTWLWFSMSSYGQTPWEHEIEKGQERQRQTEKLWIHNRLLSHNKSLMASSISVCLKRHKFLKAKIRNLERF